MVEATTAASSALRSEAGGLATHVGHFRTGQADNRRQRATPGEGMRLSA
jgi:hypothetical protein